MRITFTGRLSNEKMRARLGLQGVLLLAICSLPGCARFGRPGSAERRKGDEIVVAGRMFHTGTPVVLWMDPGGYDAYRVERRFAPLEKSDWRTSEKENRSLNSPNRYGLRRSELSADEAEEVRGGGWPLALLQEKVDQFVIHYDECGTSRQCFKVLQDVRDLSVHFMLDLDGTIYQTLDLKERAWHATTSNSRSIGIEVANIGAYQPGKSDVLKKWYFTNDQNEAFITIPPRFHPSGIRHTNLVLQPARTHPIEGRIQGEELVQYDFTPQQYEALIKLTASLCKIFPKLKCDYPRDEKGKLYPAKLPDEKLKHYQGVLGHYHIQKNKIDPGPAFQWERVINEAKKLLLCEVLKPARCADVALAAAMVFFVIARVKDTSSERLG
jgi:N-acetyl-anhydromuramyl-L-alanine amidase AmpD